MLPKQVNGATSQNKLVKPIVDDGVFAQQLSDQQLSRFAKLIYDTVGVVITTQKRAMLSNRLRKRLRENNLKDFDAYHQFLTRNPITHPEWDQFLQAVTTHETYLFRDMAQWDWFQESYLPQISKEAEAGQRPKKLRIWSAASSTGDEAYTIASCINTCLPRVESWKVQIVGTDIGCEAIRTASNPAFNERAMKHVPEGIRKRWFTEKHPGPYWTPHENLKRMTCFTQHNLLKPFSAEPFDVVFIKNVMIYFDAPSKKLVLDHVKRNMKPGAALIIGASEAVSSMMDGFKRQLPWLFIWQS